MFAKFAKLNPLKKNFFLFFRISKNCFLTIGPLSMSDGHEYFKTI